MKYALDLNITKELNLIWLTFLMACFGTPSLQAQCPSPAGIIVGPDMVCQGQTLVQYNIPHITNATSYQWTLPLGASIFTGTHTNRITVNFDDGAISGNIIVKGLNNCGEGVSSPTFRVTVKNTIPSTYQITGTAIVYTPQSEVKYSVSIPNVSQYKWSLPVGAVIVGKQDTSHIRVNFGIQAQSGPITVIATNPQDAFAIKSIPLPIVVSAATPPKAPSHLQTEVLDPPTSVHLTWQDNSDDEVAFLVYRAHTTPNQFTLIHTSLANQTSFIDSLLAPNTTYFYKIKAESSAGLQSSDGLTATITTIPGFINVPQNLQVFPAPQLQATLQWINQAAQLEGYEIYRSDDHTPFTLVAKLSDPAITSFQDANLSPLTTYDYQIRAFNGNNLSEFSPPVTVTTLDLPPAAPNQLRANVISNTTILLQWSLSSAVNTQTQFMIERSLDANLGFATIDTLPGTQRTYQDTRLTNNTTYYYRMRSFNAQGTSAYSNLSSAITSDLSAPTHLTLQMRNDSIFGVSIGWRNTANNIEGFVIERSNPLNQAGLFVKIAEKKQGYLGHTDSTGIKANQTYRYRVKTFNQIASSPYSEIVAITTPQDTSVGISIAPFDLHVRPVSENTLSLVWKGTTDSADFFNIERSEGDTTNFQKIATIPASNTEFQDEGLTNNQTYYYRVQSGNEGGESAYSNIDNATVNCNLIFEIDRIEDNLRGVCDGGTTLITTTSNSSQATYQWRRNGVNIPQATQSFYYAQTTGNYDCEMRDGQCTQTTGTVSVFVKETPRVTLGRRLGGTIILETSRVDTIIWFKNEQVLEGEHEKALTIREADFYYAMVGLEGCFSTSVTVFIKDDLINQNVASLSQSHLSKTVRTYPNPCQGLLHVTVQNPTTGPYQFWLVDVFGHTHGHLSGYKAQQVLQKRWNLEQLPAGVYFLKIQLGNQLGSKVIFKY